MLNGDDKGCCVRDEWGRKFDDLDALMLRIYARHFVPDGETFAILSEDDVPLTGEVFSTGSAITHELVALGWRVRERRVRE